MKKNKGVFCLEGHWYGDHRDTTSVYPILDLVHRFHKMPFIHHKCSTIEEFRFSIKRWKTQSFHNKYPILYLAFHGEKGMLLVGKDNVSLSELADLLEGKCRGVVIYFGGCSTLDIHGKTINNFLRTTGAIAALGYTNDVEWLISSAFDVLLMNELQMEPLDSIGIRKIHEIIIKEYGGLSKKIDFRMVINKSERFVRRRKLN